MKLLYRWVARHTGLSKIILFVTYFVLYALVLAPMQLPLIVYYFLLLFLLIPSFSVVSNCYAVLLQEPIRILKEQCDPEPLLHEAERQLEYLNESTARHQMLINKAMALSCLGEHRRSLDILENLNIDKFPSVPAVRFTYYNNLSYEMMHMDRNFEAEIWSKKALQIYRDIPAGKQRQSLDRNARVLELESLYRQGDFSLVLSKAAWLPCDNQSDIISAAMLAAQCHIALEEWEKAENKLRYILEHGNKMGYVHQARELLDSISTQTQEA